MKRIILILALCLLAVFVSAADVALVNYYNSSTESHACSSGNPLCAYNKVAQVPSIYWADCALTPGAVKIIGLSDPTDAHVEAGTATPQTYNDYKACMSSNVFSGNICYYTWEACDTQHGFNCLFGLSDMTNAHLSSCGLFSPAYKFCCNFVPAQAQCPIRNLSVQKNDYNFGQMVSFDYSCPNDLSAVDVNILIDANTFLRIGGNQCPKSGTAHFDINSASLNMQGYNPKSFAAIMTNTDGSCPTGMINFTVTIPGSGVIVTPPKRCKIKSISADPLKLDAEEGSSVSVGVNYSCYEEGVPGKVIIFDPNGNVQNGPAGANITCGTIEQKYSAFQITPSSGTGIYWARIADADGNCMKDAFFAVTKASSSSSNIPDTGMAAVVVVLAMTVLIISAGRRHK